MADQVPASVDGSGPPNVPDTHTSDPKTRKAAPAEKKLSGAELKKLKQAEKAAKRAAAKAQGGPSDPLQAQEAPKKDKQPQQLKGQKHSQPQPRRQSGSQPQTPRDAAQSREIPLRRRPSTSAPAVQPPPPEKKVGLFGHLYGQPRRHGIAGASKDVHPAVLALGLQMSSYEICGSTARCVAMLLAFKSVIQSYRTPPSTSLARHLTSHPLSPQIDYLRQCRPLSISMGNAIRSLKDSIIKIDPDMPEHEAKQHLCDTIDNFIRERIVAADALICEQAAKKVRDGDVILTFAKSALVLKTILEAKKKGTKFRVVVVDSKPLFEGKRLAQDLAAAGIDVSYSLISAASHAVQEATQVFLGSAAMMGNGRLYSRVGTAVVAMLAHEAGIPVIVCCESVKFTERVALDSIVSNDVAPAEELLLEEEDGVRREGSLQKWRDAPNLQMLNILHDVTPAEYVQMVVTEYGSLPPSSVPAVLRILETKG